MTSKKDCRVPPSTQVSPLDSQRSACALEGIQLGQTGQASANASPGTPRMTTGQLLGGRYRIERELGEGGMGVVYLVADEQVVGERFAAKVLNDELHPDVLALLREEVRKTRKLSHPNVVDVHSVNVDGQRLYVLMEYLEGKPLDALLNEEFARGMPFSHAWPIIEDVGHGVGNAHDHNVIHSDLKPANMFVTTSGRTKLLDFGIARVSRGPLLHAQTGPRALTPAYASCEMLEGKEADRRDDIYSLACVVYEMLCGSRPFKDLTALEARQTAVQVSPVEGLSRGQNAALARALTFNRETRTTSVEELLAGLRDAHPPRGRAAAYFAGVAVAVALAVGVTYVALDRLQSRQHSVVVTGEIPNSQQTGALASPPASGAVSPPQQSIAVLPFVNISGDKEQEYFSDGLSEELIDHLVRGTDLKVIARSSSFQFKGKSEDARTVARQLAVTHLLEGSVRRDRGQLRITAQLIRASDGVDLWSHTYHRNLVDIFKIQDEIAGDVAQALHVTFANVEQTGSGRPDVEPYNLVLEGNYYKARWTQRDLDRAIELYRKAIALRPDYALAWARLAGAYFDQQALNGTASPEDNRRILEALDRALRLDPKLALAYFTRAGFEATVSWNWKAAAADAERMRELEPGNELVPVALGGLALTFGYVDRAVELYKQALERDPLDPRTLAYFAESLCAANRVQECLQAHLRLLQLHPEFGGVNSRLGTAQLQAGRLAQALESMQKEPEESIRLAGLAIVYFALGRRADSDVALQSLERDFAATDAFAIAEAHAYRGEIDAAFDWLERAYRQRDVGISSVLADPLLRNLHADNRFRALLVKLKLPPETTFPTGERRT
jgi:TolB-like protein/predicted Ser/Thr protein kinase